MFPTSNQAINLYNNSHQIPEPLLRSVEKFYLGVTEPLDPYIAISLTNLSMKLVETVYLMGYQDGQKLTQTCNQCKDGKCVFSEI
jgi:hypothetical protein